MGGLLSELGKKLAERWLSLLVLPGVLYLAVAAAARTLGWRHALDIGLLTRQITAHAKTPAATSTGGQVMLLATIVIAAAAAGVAAQAAGAFLERLILAARWLTWPAPAPALIGWWVRHRRQRWDEADRIHHAQYQLALAPDPADRPDPAIRHTAAGIRARIAVERPERPTWSGDRIQAAALRLDRDHHLDLATCWPYLELTLPDTVRTQITDARTALSRATTLAGWAMLYAPLTWWWWPAIPLTTIIAASARHRIRTCADTYARLIETATRLHTPALATQLGIDHTGPLTPELGAALTRHLRTQLPPPTTPTDTN
ncbi:hypothetical protein [Actinoallomurus rhizosphaericola]|uniref:hypothetical protein n=1 Tax=Actinoallomurus rhizosphaericola TaxID=2952536 RepID=UPI002092739E|nr:hypothetical protein [Actinoallomurus rhizosphaericola]MCO5999814.1 hypothetical protein [Actinoallomurus rhizosphaericola]